MSSNLRGRINATLACLQYLLPGGIIERKFLAALVMEPMP
jgi:hypothetical protein